MHSINVYLTFNTNCREAMEYYQLIFGGELMFQVSDEKDAIEVFGDKFDKLVIHSTLQINQNITLMASDSWQGQEVIFGNSAYVSINCSSLEEINNFFNKFSQEAKFIKMHLQDTFWNAKFGILTDKFGINWMFNYQN